MAVGLCLIYDKDLLVQIRLIMLVKKIKGAETGSEYIRFTLCSKSHIEAPWHKTSRLFCPSPNYPNHNYFFFFFSISLKIHAMTWLTLPGLASAMSMTLISSSLLSSWAAKEHDVHCKTRTLPWDLKQPPLFYQISQIPEVSPNNALCVCAHACMSVHTATPVCISESTNA